MSTFRSTSSVVAHRAARPNLVVGWAAGLLQVWPAEDTSIEALAPLRRIGIREDARRERGLIAS